MIKINPAIISAIYFVIIMFSLAFLIPENIMGIYLLCFAVISAVIVWWQDNIWRKLIKERK